ncbi:MAG: succinyl-diaminopimelate desuccinylase [Rhodospirillaceae bacterium]|nr:succinyl-diaminopimelate desuccinylase [Rhodospirillaceae bacterium]
MSTPINALELAQSLIRCPSVTPADEGALDLLQSSLEPLGFTCHRMTFSEKGTADVDNLYARLGSEGPNFCYAGHTDVVPVGNEAGWTVDPFGGTVVDGVLYGRGATDMKGGIACFIAGLSKFLERRSGKFQGSISLLITGDEEGPSINGTRKILDWMEEQGETLDACIVGEPTNPMKLGEMVKIGRRGSISGWLTVHGTQGHTAYPHLADNPLPRLIAMLSSITAEPLDEGTDHFQPSNLQLTTVDVENTATNIIPGEARAAFNIRFNDLHTSETLINWLRNKFDAVGGEYDIKFQITGEAFLTPPGKLSDILSGAVEKATGIKPDLSTTGGTSDARFIKDFCPIAEFGLISQTMHKVDECVNLADLEKLTEIYDIVLDNYFSE